MLLDGARQGVQVARTAWPDSAAQAGNASRAARRRCPRPPGRLRDARQPGRGGGVDDVEPRVAFPLVSARR